MSCAPRSAAPAAADASLSAQRPLARIASSRSRILPRSAGSRSSGPAASSTAPAASSASGPAPLMCAPRMSSAPILYRATSSAPGVIAGPGRAGGPRPPPESPRARAARGSIAFLHARTASLLRSVDSDSLIDSSSSSLPARPMLEACGANMPHSTPVALLETNSSFSASASASSIPAARSAWSVCLAM